MKSRIKFFTFPVIVLWIISFGFTAAYAQEITISGIIQWTDSRGGNNNHPVRQVPVEIRDHRGQGAGEVITLLRTVNTDDQGNFTANVPAGPAPGNNRTISIRVPSRSAAVSLRNPSVDDEYSLVSDKFSNIANGTTQTINFTAQNQKVNEIAFSVLDSVTYASAYARQMTGVDIPLIKVYYPANRSTSMFDGDVHIIGDDRWDWDIIWHEYGHYVSKRFNIANNPGGAHSINEDLAATLGKRNGMLMAWAEGWSSYFGVSGQQILAINNIPNVGDSRYTDTEDSQINQDLETHSPSVSLGEANELAVMRILYDLYDPAEISGNDAGDQVALGGQAVWTRLIGGNPRPLMLFQGWSALTASAPVEESVRISTIFSEHNAAPEPSQPQDRHLITTTPPTFTWEAKGCVSSHLHNRFVLEFYDANWRLIFTSPERTVTNYRPTQADWGTITAAGNAAPIRWIIRGRNTTAPVSGPYMSRPRTFIR